MVCQSVTGWAPASREVESHGGSFCASTVRRIGFAAAFAPRLFPCDGPCQTLTVRWWRNQLHSPASPHLLRVASFRLPPKAFRPRLSCQGFFPLRGATEGIELCVGAQPTASSALRLSQPLDGLLHLRLRGPVPSHSHVQGLLFRGFSLRAATLPSSRRDSSLPFERRLLLARGRLHSRRSATSRLCSTQRRVLRGRG